MRRSSLLKKRGTETSRKYILAAGEGQLTNTRGQIAMEYILLLIVGVSIWLMLVSGLVSRNPESPGAIVVKWQQILQFIGQDKIDQ